MNKLPELQKTYDAMKKIADSSIRNNIPLSSDFGRELYLMTKLINSLGGKV